MQTQRYIENPTNTNDLFAGSGGSDHANSGLLPPGIRPSGNDLDSIRNFADKKRGISFDSQEVKALFFRKEFRKKAYDLRSDLSGWFIDNHIKSGICWCGTHRDKEKGVNIESKEQKAYYTGINRCALHWVCPVCCMKVASVQKEKLERYVSRSFEMGETLYFITLTNRHNLSDRLEDLISQAQKAWRTLGKNSRFIRNKIEGYYLTFEIKYSQETGWHPHYHILLNLGSETVWKSHKYAKSQIKREIVDKWLDLMPKARNQGQDIQQVKEENKFKVSSYISKSNMSAEMVYAAAKERGQSLSPWELLEHDLSHKWKEYLKATKGKASRMVSRKFWDKIEETNTTEQQDVDQSEKADLKHGTLHYMLYQELRRKQKLVKLLEHVEENPFDMLDRPFGILESLTGKRVSVDYCTGQFVNTNEMLPERQNKGYSPVSKFLTGKSALPMKVNTRFDSS